MPEQGKLTPEAVDVEARSEEEMVEKVAEIIHHFHWIPEAYTSSHEAAKEVLAVFMAHNQYRVQVVEKEAEIARLMAKLIEQIDISLGWQDEACKLQQQVENV